MKVNYQGKDTTVVLKDCNEPRWVKVKSTASTRYINISPIELNNATAQQKTELPIYKIVVGDMSSIKIPVTDIGDDTKIANCGVIEENGKQYFTLNTDAISFINLETGEVLPVDPSKPIEAGSEYIARLQLTTGAGGVDYEGCKVGYVFFKIQVLPQTVVWRPADTKINDNVYGLYLEPGGKFDGDRSLIKNNLEADVRNESEELAAQGKRINRNIWHRIETAF